MLNSCLRICKLKHNATKQYNTLQHPATQCNTLPYVCRDVLPQSAANSSNLAAWFVRYNTLQLHTATTHCKTIQHNTTHYETLTEIYTRNLLQTAQVLPRDSRTAHSWHLGDNRRVLHTPRFVEHILMIVCMETYRMCDMTHSYVWNDSYTCVPWLIQNATWLNDMFDTTLWCDRNESWHAYAWARAYM